MRVHLRKMLCYLGGVFVLVFHLWLHYVATPLATLSAELGDAEGLTQQLSGSHSSSHSPSGEGQRLTTHGLATRNASRRARDEAGDSSLDASRLSSHHHHHHHHQHRPHGGASWNGAEELHWDYLDDDSPLPPHVGSKSAESETHYRPALNNSRKRASEKTTREKIHPHAASRLDIIKMDAQPEVVKSMTHEEYSQTKKNHRKRGSIVYSTSIPTPEEGQGRPRFHHERRRIKSKEKVGWRKTRVNEGLSENKAGRKDTVEHPIGGGEGDVISNRPSTTTYQGAQSRSETYHRGEVKARYMFNCSNIDQIAIKRTLGHGVTKQVYLGLYGDLKVAVKMVTRNVIDVTSCVKTLAESGTLSEQTRGRCFAFPNMKLMKEILLLEQLQHPNLLRMLGYCVRSEETESTSLQEHGVTAVYEYGLRFYLSTLSGWPYEARVRAAVELTDLLQYLAASPLGSLRVADFKDAHFLLKDGQVKLTDMDDVTSAEPTCLVSKKLTDAEQQTSLFISPSSSKDGRRVAPIRQQQGVCPYKLKCIGGVCLGYNAKHNLRKMNDLFFRNLLVLGVGDSHPGSAAQDAAYQILQLTRDLENLTIDAAHLKRRLLRLLDQENSTPGYS